jgi:hypothetical protein
MSYHALHGTLKWESASALRSDPWWLERACCSEIPHCKITKEVFDPISGRRVDRKREFEEGKKKRNEGRPIHLGSLDTPLKREISTQKGERYGASKAEGTEVRDEDRIYRHWECQARPRTGSA